MSHTQSAMTEGSNAPEARRATPSYCTLLSLPKVPIPRANRSQMKRSFEETTTEWQLCLAPVSPATRTISNYRCRRGLLGRINSSEIFNAYLFTAADDHLTKTPGVGVSVGLESGTTVCRPGLVQSSGLVSELGLPYSFLFSTPLVWYRRATHVVGVK